MKLLTHLAPSCADVDGRQLIRCTKRIGFSFARGTGNSYRGLTKFRRQNHRGHSFRLPVNHGYPVKGACADGILGSTDD